MPTLETRFDSFWELSLEQKFAYVFNRTALGIACLLGLWHLIHQNWWESFLIFGVLFPVYFLLWHAVGAP